ncbi:TonB-dependent receptor [Nitrospirillum pindoramense]|uniref:Iron complex outermembrane receptor protein n=1 Tax=Nitrospirillum amazonense TaxID=28077 RepID=A0A560H5S9_9PROT|nr:TonB-dependent receptor [Nitrospirillum amazonense]TWB41665.1 iron complex outermembrane receptor protein [Nitrospirillum amazonense]
MIKKYGSFFALCGTALAGWAVPAWAQSAHFDLPAQPAARSIPLFAQQAGIQILAPTDLLDGISTAALRGDLDRHQALARLLKGTPLVVASDDGRTVVLKLAPTPVSTAAPVRKAQAAASGGPGAEPQVADAAGGALDEVVVTGTRDRGRTQFTTMTPVDVLSAKDLQDGASNQLLENLTQVIPGFNVQKLPSSDGGQFIRPAHLRGLSPDQTLVLINGKRFHRTAYLGTRGAQGPDLAQIPDFAIGRVEVLRDGASAQYGSDAIAGVINIQLDDRPGVYGYMQGSQYYAGDGTTWNGGLRGATEIGDGGHLMATAEWSDGTLTSRTHQRADAQAFQAANPQLSIANPVQRWGRPDESSYHYAVDGLLPVGAVELYGFMTIATGEGMNDINWRIPDPKSNSSVYGLAPKVFPGWDLRSVYPNGFTPKEGIKYTDYQAAWGARGHVGTDLDWDLSGTYGENESRFFLNNSINASLGPSSPYNFNLGTQRQDEFNLNADGVYRLDAGLDEPLNIAFGAERRLEIYTVEAGDKASYQVGPGAAAGLASGANGFPGFSDLQAGSWYQTSYAGYLDMEAKLTPDWTVGAAGRYETYSGFGDKMTYKASTRYEITPDLALRASYSTGFRAPTPGQINSLSTSQGLDTKTLQLFTSGRLSPDNPLAVALGAKPLSPETSRNYSLGAVWRTDVGLSGSVDAYQVDVDHRFSSSPTINLTAAQKAQLVAQGVPGADNFTSVYWFTNDFNTRTQGLDVVLDYTQPVFDTARIDMKLAYNHNLTMVTGGSLNANPTQKVLYEQGLPKNNITGSLTYSDNPFDYQVRVRYYGGWTDSSGNSTGDIFQTFDGITFVDLSVTYHITENLAVKVAGENIFDTYPAKAIYQASRGIEYSRNAPYDTYGGRYYVRFNAAF